MTNQIWSNMSVNALLHYLNVSVGELVVQRLSLDSIYLSFRSVFWFHLSSALASSSLLRHVRSERPKEVSRTLRARPAE